MGLILKEEHNSDNNNYKARYVELAKPIAGVLTLAIYPLIASMIDDPDVRIKVSNNIATFICWILGEHIIHRMCIYFNLYTKAHTKNPLYRNLKTLSSLGAALGIILASLLGNTLSCSLYNMIMASVVALFAFIFRQFNKNQEISIDAQIGTEGWSKYAKTALVLGSLIGQFIGAMSAYINHYDSATSLNNIMLYGAIASVASFISVTLLVPFINYITRYSSTIRIKGILIADDRDVFNNNYVRSGMTLGAAIGTILGGLLGAAGLISIPIAIALSTSVFSIIGGLTLGYYGQDLSLYFERFWGVSHNTDNSWSYATRSTAYFFSCASIALIYVLCPAAALTQCALIGSALASLIGWFVGLFIIWLARKIEPDETKTNATTLPWTQRLSIGASRGAIIGTMAGLALGCFLGPFSLIGWCVFAGAVGSILGAIKELVCDDAFAKITNKAVNSLTNQGIPPKDNICSLNATSKYHRYTLFSGKKTILECTPELNLSNYPPS